jgi:CO/xanthine dehydrogenase FAD-binding subunit
MIMKPVTFDYYTPKSVGETFDLLTKHGTDGKILAGGQTLVPLLNMRLVKPASIIDINQVMELDGIQVNSQGLFVGALTRQQTLLEDRRVAEGWPLLVDATGYIGHRAIRNRGTIGGSLAYGNPSAELPAAMVALNAEIIARSPGRQRNIPAKEFFLGPMKTALQPDELLTHVQLPSLPARAGWAFLEVSHRQRDLPLVAVAALVALDDSGNCSDARLVLAGVGSKPHTVDVPSQMVGQNPTPELIDAAAHVAVANLEPNSDLHASADYRRHAAQTLSRRALILAVERARERS